MHSSRFQNVASRFSPTNIRTSFRRSLSASSRASSTKRNSYSSHTTTSSTSASPVADTINSVVFRQPSVIFLEEERRSFGSELNILEPRPIVYWGSLEERMGSF